MKILSSFIKSDDNAFKWQTKPTCFQNVCIYEVSYPYNDNPYNSQFILMQENNSTSNDFCTIITHVTSSYEHNIMLDSASYCNFNVLKLNQLDSPPLSPLVLSMTNNN